MKPFRDDNTAGYTSEQLDRMNRRFEELEPDAYDNEMWPEEGRKESCERILNEMDAGQLPMTPYEADPDYYAAKLEEREASRLEYDAHLSETVQAEIDGTPVYEVATPYEAGQIDARAGEFDPDERYGLNETAEYQRGFDGEPDF